MDSHTQIETKQCGTEYANLVSSQSGGNIDVEPITIGESGIQPTPSAKNIVVIFNSSLNRDSQIGKVCHI